MDFRRIGGGQVALEDHCARTYLAFTSLQSAKQMVIPDPVPSSHGYRAGDRRTGETADHHSTTIIRTPDRRLRVFVSSTLSELAAERRVVARAISTLRLTPVMFELGARPHSARDVYRAYLEQSDVFIGLYWQSYGWLGPGMDISGLEDEFELARSLPRLMYVKAPAPHREQRLTQMLSRMKADVSYRAFRTSRELGRLVRDDLATLLSERFAASPAATDRDSRRWPAAAERRARSLPRSATSLVGRDQAIDEVADLITRPGIRLVTLTGPGGVGKTRLALAVGERTRDRFRAGTVFVPLAGVTRTELVIFAIARAMGVDLTGVAAPLQGLVEQLCDDALLLIVDNLEHLVGAARDLSELLARCPGVAILTTSRTVLQLSGEREYPVAPLALPDDSTAMSVEVLASLPPVALFVDRARAVRNDFSLTKQNAAAVVEICRRLEGLPLAIELAAARARLLDPDSLLERLKKSLGVLGTATVDLPERQRTLRATVDWSVDLLDDVERSLLETVSVFVDGWTLAAAASISGLDEQRALEVSEALARQSLIYVDRTLRDPRLRMLDTLRQFIAERLAVRPDFAEVERRHAHYFRILAEQADRTLRDVGHGECLDRLEAEAGNLAVAVNWYLAHNAAPLPHLFRVLLPFWEQRDHMAEARPWIERLLPSADTMDLESRAEVLLTALVSANEVGDDTAALAALHRLALLVPSIQDAYLQAVCKLAMAWSAPVAGNSNAALHLALESLEQFRNQDEPFWTAVALATVGNLELIEGRYDAAQRRLTEARDLSNKFNNAWLAAWSRVQFGVLAVLEDRLQEARTFLEQGLELSLAVHSTPLVSLCLVGFVRLALVERDLDRAALLVGAAEGLRGRVSLRAWPMLRQEEAALVSEVRRLLGADRFDRMYALGTRLNQREAIAAIHAPVGESAVTGGMPTKS